MELQIPTGLTDMLQEFTVVVLRERPEDIVDFAANYFKQLKLKNQKSRNVSRGVTFGSEEKESDQEDEEEPFGKLSYKWTSNWHLTSNVVLRRSRFTFFFWGYKPPTAPFLYESYIQALALQILQQSYKDLYYTLWIFSFMLTFILTEPPANRYARRQSGAWNLLKKLFVGIVS